MVDKVIDLSRRQFLKKTGAMIGSGFIFCYCPITLAFDSSVLIDRQLALFSKISSILTARDDLSPALMRLYYETLRSGNEAESFQLLLRKADYQHIAEMENALTKELHQNTMIGQMIKKIMKMWYLGDLDNKTISIAAYQQSLVWKIAGTTPPGVSAGNDWRHILKRDGEVSLLKL